LGGDNPLAIANRLARCICDADGLRHEGEGVELLNCPRYIREWIHRDVGDPKEEDL